MVIIQWLETKFFVTQMRKLLWATFFQNDIDFFFFCNINQLHMAHRFQAGSIKEKPLKRLSEATNFIR